MAPTLSTALRAVRVRRRLRQEDVARLAACAPVTVSRAERGLLDQMTLATVLRIAAALEIRVDLVPRWRGGELDRLVNAEHAALLEQVSRRLSRADGWTVAPEVTFSVYGERGSVDLLAWHPARRALLVIELKTAIVDVNDLLMTLDRKRRLAPRIAREREWEPEVVGSWLIVSEGMTNRRRAMAHRASLSAALPAGGADIARWLRDPSSPIGALSFLSIDHGRNVGQCRRGAQRVYRRGSCESGVPAGHSAPTSARARTE